MGAGSGDITLENFDAALEFLTRTGPVNIGLIGGEPTLHPHFDEIVRRAVACENVAMLTVYTNGLLIEKHADVLSLPKVTLLVNWNAPSELREGAFERIMCGVDELVFNRGMGRRINLGLNLHGETMEYGYMLDLLKRYGFDKVWSKRHRAFPRMQAVPAEDVCRYGCDWRIALLRLQPSPVVHMVRRGKAVASRFGGPPCSARDLSKRFWSYAGPFF